MHQKRNMFIENNHIFSHKIYMVTVLPDNFGTPLRTYIIKYKIVNNASDNSG